MGNEWDRVDYYSVVYFPSLPEEPIGSFRRAHDPTAGLIDPHLTLVFPIPASIGGEALRGHVRRVASETPSFYIRLKGLEKSWDHWLFLLVAEGREKTVALHDSLYGGRLRPHLRSEQPYVPHVGLGLFVEERDAHDLLELRPRTLDRVRFEKARKEAEAMELDYVCRVGGVHIVGVDAGLTRLTLLEGLPLGCPP